MPVSFQNFHQLKNVVNRGGFAVGIGLTTQKYIGVDVYLKYQKMKHNRSNMIPLQIHDVWMFVDPDDEGISAELLRYGKREEEATEKVREILKSENDKVGKTTVLEIGANRGYYAFQEADILNNDSQIYAIEPDPDNIKSLNKGKEMNGFSNIKVEQCAIGNSTGKMELKRSVKSNCHTLGEVPKERENEYYGTVKVNVHTLESYVRKENIKPSNVDIVRLDVEGYECEIFDTMSYLFEHSSPTTIFVELHPHRVDPERLFGIVDTLEENEFNLEYAGSSRLSNIEDFDTVRKHISVENPSHATEVIATKHEM